MIVKTRNIPDGKDQLKHAPIRNYLKAEKVYFPVTSARCLEGETCVIEGQYVKVGEVIGDRKSSFFEQPIHSTVSGRVLGFERHYDSNGKLLDCVVVENDQKYELHESVVDRTEEEIANLKKEDFINIAKDMGLVGLGGSAFPTYIKLSTSDPIDVVVVNGVECEPFLVSDYQLMLKKPYDLINGLIYAMRASGAKKGVIAIKKKYMPVKKLLDEVIREFTDYDITVKAVGNHYPQGWEIETVEHAIGKRIPQGEMLSSHGVLVFNSSTLISFYEAVNHRQPVLERYIVLVGDGITNQIFKVRIGTLLSELVEEVGGYLNKDIPKVLVVGGPMMGSNVESDNIVMTHTTTSLIVLNEEELFEDPCIHCAACVYSCPVNIQPVQIMNAVKRGDLEALIDLNVTNCIECGLCSYVCPSKIHLTDYMREGKNIVWGSEK